MSSHAKTESPRGPVSVAQERRKHPRHPGNALVRVIRESDTRRLNLPVELVDLSITGLGILAAESLTPDERIKIRLRNDIRRFFKEVHGVVRWVKVMDEGRFRVGIELNSRFTALDMQLLKQVGTTGDQGQKVWI
jgi:hypothetical protein